MKVQVRQGVFETNSSSTHSVTLASGKLVNTINYCQLDNYVDQADHYIHMKFGEFEIEEVDFCNEKGITDINKLKEAGMLNLMTEIEMPLSYVLYDMEKEGVIVKREELKEYGEALTERIEELEQSIYKQAGELCHFRCW